MMVAPMDDPCTKNQLFGHLILIMFTSQVIWGGASQLGSYPKKGGAEPHSNLYRFRFSKKFLKLPEKGDIQKKIAKNQGGG
jgi:hypothetical protein